VKRYAILYLATLVVIIPIDFLFLGTVAKGFFASQLISRSARRRRPPRTPISYAPSGSAKRYWLSARSGVTAFDRRAPGMMDFACSVLVMRRY
jgi:hypothetical protein